MKTLPFALLTGFGVFLFLATGFANTMTVDTAADLVGNPALCSLRAAIQSAEMHASVDGCATGAAGEDVIVFAPGVTGAITLNSPLPTVTESLQITGPGAGILKIDANASIEAFHIDDGGTHRSFSISGLTVTGATQNGLRVFAGNLSLDEMVFTQNLVGVVFGHAEDTLTITRSTFSKNGDATSSTGGGGLDFLGGHLKLSDSTFSENTAASGGGIQFAGDFSNCNGSTPCSGELTNVTIAGNKVTSSAGGMGMGASFGSVPITLTNVTIAGNQANTDGGTGGFGGGIFLQSNVDLTLENTIIANNAAGGTGGVPDDCRVTGGTLVSNGANLVREVANCTGLATSDITGEDPLLGTLAANGGPTQTLLLLEGSPAIDAAKASDAPSKDQRGVSRPLGALPDIGAVEIGCGDGVVETGEVCDAGSANSDTQADACRIDCTEPRCGDHVVDSGEECDDGNTVSEDGCDLSCQDETGAGTATGATAGGATGGSTGDDSGNGGCSLIRDDSRDRPVPPAP